MCHDAAGQALEWDASTRRPKLNEDKCLSCMVCSFVCPIPNLITYKEQSRTWKREDVANVGRGLESELKYVPYKAKV